MAKFNTYKVAAIAEAAVSNGDFSAVMNKIFDCNFVKIGNEAINVTVGDNNCITYQPGIVWPGGIAPEGVDVSPGVKIKYEGQFFWMTQDSYDELVGACNNDCCN